MANAPTTSNRPMTSIAQLNRVIINPLFRPTHCPVTPAVPDSSSRYPKDFSIFASRANAAVFRSVFEPSFFSAQVLRWHFSFRGQPARK